jgi:glycosyltransferase involved in cell wall biosynthesis
MKTLLIGKKECVDYAGAKTIYLYNALTGAGKDVEVYDVSTSTDVPRGVGASIYLPWTESIDQNWHRFLKTMPGRRILYTDNWHWYDHVSGKMVDDHDLRLDELFHVVGLATTENIRWWPKSKFEWWGVVVDEDMALPRADQGYVWVDEMWPSSWCPGRYSANEVLDIAMPLIKERFGVSVLSQACSDEKSPSPEWVDEWVPRNSQLETMLAAIAGSRAFLTSHHECLGLMQFEAMVSGVPVVTNPKFSKQEVFAAGESAQAWCWDDRPDEEPPDVSAAVGQMVEAFDRACALDRSSVRETAIGRFGKKAFLDRVRL